MTFEDVVDVFEVRVKPNFRENAFGTIVSEQEILVPLWEMLKARAMATLAAKGVSSFGELARDLRKLDHMYTVLFSAFDVAVRQFGPISPALIPLLIERFKAELILRDIELGQEDQDWREFQKKAWEAIKDDLRATS